MIKDSGFVNKTNNREKVIHMILKKNVGHIESIVRVTIGALIMAAGLYFDSWWGFVGLIPVFSGGVSFCPIYRALDIDTTEPNTERAN